MPRVVHFEISADNPERAVQFYQKAFGWKIEKWQAPQEYWLITTGPDKEPGINGAIMKRPDPKASIINTIGVPSIDESIAKVNKNGGKVVTEKMQIPDIGIFAYCLDTEGNTFGILQPQMPAAKK
jgi:predicted enzyme related to lactoylglutathione lyase